MKCLAVKMIPSESRRFFTAKSVSVNQFLYFLSRPFAPDNDNIKQRKKGETQCFAGYLLRSRFVLIDNRWKKVLEEQ